MSGSVVPCQRCGRSTFAGRPCRWCGFDLEEGELVEAKICPPGKGGEYRCGPCSDMLSNRRSIEIEEGQVIPALGLSFTALGYSRWLEVSL